MNGATRCPDALELARAACEPESSSCAGHLSACSDCSAEVESQRRLVALAREGPVLEPSPERLESVRGAVLAAACAPAAPRRSWPRVAAAIAASALVALGLKLYRAPSTQTASPRSEWATAVHPQPGARFVHASGPPDQIVRLREGTLTVSVAPLGPGERFRVIVGDAEVEVHGTAFDVTAHDDRLVEVRVLRGRVAVRPARQGEVVLLPGDTWAAPPAPVAPAPAFAGSSTGPSPPPNLPRRTPIVSLEPRRLHLEMIPTAIAPRPLPPALPVGVAEERLALVRVQGVTGSGGEVDAGASADASGETPAEVAFEQGWAALRAGDAAAAALFLDRAVKAAGGAPIGEDASFWRAVALGRSARPSEAVRAFRSFLDAYPDSNRSGEASVMLGRLLLARGDISGARQLFRDASADRAQRVREAARAGLEMTRDVVLDLGAR
jgi:hypothetical protein